MRSIRFDFLILDVVLPKRDEPPCAEFGLALLNDIKKRPTIKSLVKLLVLQPNLKILSLLEHNLILIVKY